MIAPPEAERGGGPSVEAVLIAGILGLVIVFALATGRLVTAESSCEQAARAAARIASIQRDPATARPAAEDAARQALAARGIVCDSLNVAVDVTGFSRTLGEPAAVRADVACAVRWSDLALPGAPGTHQTTASFTSAIDQLRERT